MVELKSAGVSDSVIQAMRDAQSTASAAGPVNDQGSAPAPVPDAQPDDPVSGHYVNDQNVSEYLDLGSAGKFSWRVGGRDFVGSYQISEDTLILRFPPVGATARGKLDAGRFNCCLSNGLGPEETKLIDDESKNWVRQGESQSVQPQPAAASPGQITFSVRHRHSTFFNFQTSDVESYCSGTLSVSPDGTVAYDCSQTEDPSGRCEHLSFAPGSLKQAKIGFAGSLHLESKTQGKFDFYGSRDTLSNALAAIAPQVKK